MFRKTARKESGQALIFIVFGIIAMVAIAGLAIDGGAAMVNRRNAQNAADNAAMAAALAIVQDNDPYAAAYNVAADNGYDNNGDDNTVTVNISHEYSDLDGEPVQRDEDYFDEYNEFFIKVTIDTTTQTSIAKIVGQEDVESRGEAISHAKKGMRSTLYGGNALVALSPHDQDAFRILGGAMITTENSGMFVNSDDDTAMRIFGGALINTDTGLGIVGGASFTPSVMIDGYMIMWNAHNPPTVSFGVPQYPVPPDYSFIPEPPEAPSCDGLPTITKGTWNSGSDGPIVHLSPGIYPNGIYIMGGFDQILLDSGVYCIYNQFQINGGAMIYGGDVKIVFQDNGPMTINGGTSMNFDSLELYPFDGDVTIRGGNAIYADRFRFYPRGASSFYMEGGAIFDSANTFFYIPEGTVHWNGGSFLTMHAPPQDDPDGYGGLLFYQPWENTSTMTFQGGQHIDLVGSLILPHTNVTFTGGSMVNGFHTQIVAYTIHIMGGNMMHFVFNDFEQYQAPSPPIVELLK